MPDHIRAWMLHSALETEVQRLLTDPAAHARGLIEVTRLMGREGASWAGTGTAPAYRHRDLVGSEYSPAVHAGNASLYATALGAAAGERNYEVLQGLALAAVFADIALDAEGDHARVDQAAMAMRRQARMATSRSSADGRAMFRQPP